MLSESTWLIFMMMLAELTMLTEVALLTLQDNAGSVYLTVPVGEC